MILGDRCQTEQRESRVRLAHGSHDPHLAAVFQKEGRSDSWRPRPLVRCPMQPEIGLAKIVLPSLMGLVLLDRYQMLLAKARPVDQVPLVNLEGSIEAG